MSDDATDGRKMDTVALTLSRHVFRKLEQCAVDQNVALDAVVEAALVDYLAVVDRCDPEIRDLVRGMTTWPPKPP